MKKNIFRILGGIIIAAGVLLITFYIFIFLNPLGIHETNRLKWIPILIVIIGFYFSGQLNKETKVKWLPILFIPLILFKPFNYTYFPFIAILLTTGLLMLLVTRKEQMFSIKITAWLGIVFIFLFHLFNQPLIFEKDGFGYDENGKMINEKIAWNFSNNDILQLPDHALLDANGHKVNLQNIHGKTHFISFWATWCGPCMENKTELEQLKLQLSKTGNVNFIDISFDEIKDWESYINNNKLLGQQLISSNPQVTSRKLNFAGIPMYFIVDKTGAYQTFRSFEIAKNRIIKEL